jgi:hypothetical protein
MEDTSSCQWYEKLHGIPARAPHLGGFSQEHDTPQLARRST